MNSSIILMGIKHCGKSALGRIISERLSVPFYDTDSVITEMTGKSPREIFVEGGEEAFKLAEKNACAFTTEKILSENNNAVIATGGGICNNKEALEELHKVGRFVFLCAPEEIAAARILKEIEVAEDGTLSNMPAYIANKNPKNLEDVKNIFHGFYEQRVKIYSEISDLQVVVDNSTKQQNAERVLALVN